MSSLFRDRAALWLIVSGVAAPVGVAACGSSDSGSGATPFTGGVPGYGTGGAFVSTGGVGPGGFPASGGFVGSGGTLVTASGGTIGAGGTSRDAGHTADASDGGEDASTGVPVPPPTPVGCLKAEDLTPGVHQVTCDTTIDVVTVPAECTKRACGVIVDVHGGMMSSQMEDKNTNLSALGLKHGYLVIQPNALQNAILLNQRLFTADKPGAPADDTRVMDILKNVIQAFHADEDRIHMTGFSEGGFMTWRWYCQHSDMLASVAPGQASWNCATLATLGLTPPEVGCELGGGDAGVDMPEKHIPILYMTGAKDGLVDPKCSAAWMTSNVIPALGLGQAQQIAGDSTYTRTRSFTPDGVPFEHIEHQYTTTSSFLGFALAGHCYPGSTDLTVTPPAQTVVPPDQAISFGCNDKCSFNWGEEVMKFFIAHPRR